MEETLGKRIAFHRKRLSLTQDALAERLGVTAQAVSKWENDQSCPDITMLPKLADIFHVTTDELLGMEPKAVHTAEVIAELPEADAVEEENTSGKNGLWEFQWDGGRRSSLGFALWILLSGVLLFLTGDAGIDTTIWEILWTSALLMFGLFGVIYPNFSIFRLGCAFLGGYFMCTEVFNQPLSRNFILPVFLMCFGISLLINALKKPKNSRAHILYNGKSIGKTSSHCTYDGETFDCSTSFGENSYLITLPRISAGSASLSFGELEVDLTGCEAFAPRCSIELNSAFGSLDVVVPKSVRIEPNISTSFAALDIKGHPAPDACSVIYVNGSASFGEITLRYL